MPIGAELAVMNYWMCMSFHRTIWVYFLNKQKARLPNLQLELWLSYTYPS